MADSDEDRATDSGLIDNPVEPDLLRVDYSDQVEFQQRNLRDKFRVQLPIILTVAFSAQCAAAILLLGSLEFPAFVTISLAVSVLSNIASLMNYRRLRLFPGSRRLSYLLPAFALPYAISVLLLLWLRPPYSIPLLAIGATVAIGTAWVLSLISRNGRSVPMLIIPSNKTAQMLLELPGLNYRVCNDPAELGEPRLAVVVDLRRNIMPEWERALANAALNGSTIYNVKQVWESLTGRVRIDHLSENSFGTLMPNTVYFSLKNVFDRLMGVIGLIFAWPIILAGAVAIRIEGPGSPFFLQERIGFRGKPFTIVKLRTMISSAGAIDPREAAMTKVNDPRITRVGKFLRDTRIDELPQLWNVVKGDLSIIGPRPEASQLSQWYGEKLDFYAYRHVVKPGITGWAQVNQGHVASEAAVYRKLQFDFYYIKNFSLWLDIMIVFKTVAVILFRRGSK